MEIVQSSFNKFFLIGNIHLVEINFKWKLRTMTDLS